MHPRSGRNKNHIQEDYIMAWYEIHHSCGHTGRVNLIGPHKQRQWRIDRMEADICDECKERARAEENARAAAENKENGLPDLKGSDKQVAWGETIRKKVLDELDDPKDHNPTPEELADFNAAIDVLMSKQSASWWIDRRDTGIRTILTECFKESKTRTAPAIATTEAEIAAKAEATIRPEEPRTETVAEISISQGTIYVDFPEKRESFRACMRKLWFNWSGSRWQRTPGKLAGAVEDRVAETAAYLLDLNYIVRVYDEDIRRKVLDRSFDKEQRCWVICRPDTKGFGIYWPKDADFWDKAKRLPGSRWDGDKHQMLVPAEQYEQVLDFAEVHGFGVSAEAKSLAEESAKIREAALIAPSVKKEEEKVVMLAVPDGGFQVDENLRDDD